MGGTTHTRGARGGAKGIRRLCGAPLRFARRRGARGPLNIQELEHPPVTATLLAAFVPFPVTSWHGCRLSPNRQCSSDSHRIPPCFQLDAGFRRPRFSDQTTPYFPLSQPGAHYTGRDRVMRINKPPARAGRSDHPASRQRIVDNGFLCKQTLGFGALGPELRVPETPARLGKCK